ncbi:MAG: hypothetical protein IJF40_03835 [Clostridia bacterium]|nr:hypothetical protein [Clostridia bacterium]MBQ7046472.1 hypothetical protein [Oscillospiraceae bacterium]
MKKITVLFLVLLLLLSLILCGCSGIIKDTDFPVFSVVYRGNTEGYFEGEKTYDLNGAKGLKINFELPEAGFFKLLAYDATEYEEWPDEYAEAFVTFTSESKTYIDVKATYGFTDEIYFEKGDISAEITFKDAPKDMEQVYVAWAFAPDTDEPSNLKLDSTAIAKADENGNAKFALSLEKDALVRFMPSEACILEYDCNFYIENKDGKKVTSNINIHGSEWAYRVVFLPKGEYIVTVTDIETVASCYASEEVPFENVHMTPKNGLTLPATFGFNALNSEEKKATFVADANDKYLVINARGANTYYEYEQPVDIKVIDAQNNIVIEETCEGENRFDISKFSGEYTVCVSTSDACVVEISTISE